MPMGEDVVNEEDGGRSYGGRFVVVFIASFALVLVVGLGLLVVTTTTVVDDPKHDTVGYINGYAVKIPGNAVSVTLRIDIDSDQALDLYLVNGDQLLQMLELDDDVEVPSLDHVVVNGSEVVWALKEENWEDTTIHVVVDNTGRGEVPWSTTEVQYTLRMTTVSRSSVLEHPLFYIWIAVIVASFVVCGLEYRRYRAANSQDGKALVDNQQERGD
jgi:hypothetical protein